MATYTYTTTALQDAALAWLVRVENARRATLTPPPTPLTVNDVQVVNKIMTDAFTSYVQQYRDRVNQQVRDNYDAAAAGTQTTVRTSLGVDPNTII